MSWWLLCSRQELLNFLFVSRLISLDLLLNKISVVSVAAFVDVVVAVIVVVDVNLILLQPLVMSE